MYMYMGWKHLYCSNCITAMLAQEGLEIVSRICI